MDFVPINRNKQYLIFYCPFSQFFLLSAFCFFSLTPFTVPIIVIIIITKPQWRPIAANQPTIIISIISTIVIITVINQFSLELNRNSSENISE